MHFHLLSSLNQYSSFVSLAQVFAACTALYVLVFYSVRSIKANGFSYWHALSWLGFVLSLVGIGYLGEYKVQRTAQYLKCYSIQQKSLLQNATGCHCEAPQGAAAIRSPFRKGRIPRPVFKLASE